MITVTLSDLEANTLQELLHLGHPYTTRRANGLNRVRRKLERAR